MKENIIIPSICKWFLSGFYDDDKNWDILILYKANDILGMALFKNWWPGEVITAMRETSLRVFLYCLMMDIEGDWF
jgi:hypothetical protein